MARCVAGERGPERPRNGASNWQPGSARSRIPKTARNSCNEGLVKLIASAAELPGLNDALRAAETLFLDTEFESNRSGIELCLLQISTGTEIFLVDAIALRDLTPLAGSFQESALWVLHAGQQDVMLIGDRLKLKSR